jgi:hypothetical protein
MGSTLFSKPLSQSDEKEVTSTGRSTSAGSSSDATLEISSFSDWSSSVSTSPADSDDVNRIFDTQLHLIEEDDSYSAESSSDESMTKGKPRSDEEIALDKLLNPLSYYLPNPPEPSEELQKLFRERMAERASSGRTILQEVEQDKALKVRNPQKSGNSSTIAKKQGTTLEPSASSNKNITFSSHGSPINVGGHENIAPKKLIGILRRPSLDNLQTPRVQKRVRIDLNNVEIR